MSSCPCAAPYGFSSRITVALRLLAAAVLLSLLMPLAPAGADYLSTPGAAKRGIEVITRKIGGTPRLLEIDILPSTVTMRVQGREKSHHVDEWVASRGGLSLFGDSVSGPFPGRGSSYVDEIEGGFFDLAEVSFEGLDAMMKAAIARAALEDPPTVTRVGLARRILTSPRPAYGEVRWTIQVASRSESASVVFTPKGTIQAVDLSSTLRVKRLDLLRDRSVLPTAAAEIAAVLGPAPVVRDISFNRTYIFIRADSPGDPNREARYSWNLNGMRGGPDETPSVFRRDPKRLFAFSEIDLGVLAALEQAAYKALAMEGGRVSQIKAEKPAETFGPSQVLWEMEITSRDNQKGRVFADVKGKIVKVVPPAHKRAPMVWLEPSSVRGTLARLASEIGATTRMLELLINDRGASLTVEDPDKPGGLVNLVVDEDSIRRFGKPLFEKRLDPARSFTVADLAALDEAALETLIRRTMERLKLREGKLVRITISRGDVFVRSPGGKVMLELRTETADGDNGGRVIYAIDGKELDVVEP